MDFLVEHAVSDACMVTSSRIPEAEEVGKFFEYSF